MNIRVGSLLDLSTIDWPCHRTYMIFCSGCNFHCPFCMNAPLIPLTSGREVSLNFVEERILSNMGFLDAVGISGGEPSLQPQPITEIYRWARRQGIETFFNSNGSNPKLLCELLVERLLDHVAIDVKAPLKPEIYGKVSGLAGDVERITADIRHSLELCRNSGLPVEVRTTVVPTLIDDENSIRETAKIAREYGTHVLQQFFPFEDVLDKRLRRVKPPDRAALVKLAGFSLEEGVREVYIRTSENGLERIK